MKLGPIVQESPGIARRAYPYGKEARGSRYLVLIGPSSLRVNHF